MLEILIIVGTFVGITLPADLALNLDNPVGKANRLEHQVDRLQAKLDKGFEKNDNPAWIWNARAVERADIKAQKIQDKIAKTERKIADLNAEIDSLRDLPNNGRYNARKQRRADRLQARAQRELDKQN